MNKNITPMLMRLYLAIAIIKIANYYGLDDPTLLFPDTDETTKDTEDTMPNYFLGNGNTDNWTVEQWYPGWGEE